LTAAAAQPSIDLAKTSGASPPATEAITLASLADRPIHVGWNVEPQRRGGKPTKVPYSPKDRRAKCGEGDNGNPSGWGTRAAATAWAMRQPGRVEIRRRGIGIVLGVEIGGSTLAGIDLDTCLNPETGEMAPWAQEILDRFPSYAEVSPSKTGVKIFFLVRAEDKAELATYPKAYRKPGGGDHTPGIECYVGGRYFTITDKLYGTETALREIPIETVQWLHEVAGPALRGKPARERKERKPREPTPNDLPWSPGEEARLRSALKAIPNDGKYGLDYDEWLAVQMAIHSTGWPCAEAMADEFSQRCGRYNRRDQAYKWDSYRTRVDGVTVATIYGMAFENGWEDPGSDPPLEEVHTPLSDEEIWILFPADFWVTL